MLTINQMAPTFSLPDQDGKIHKLEDFLGSWVLVYFYPKDLTPGCTTEACSFRDNYQLLAPKVTIIGISTDSQLTHYKFASKYQLPFLLLADVDKQAVADYQAYGLKKFMGREFMGTYRISYLINPDGKIVKVYPKVNPKNHVAEIIADLNKLQ